MSGLYFFIDLIALQTRLFSFKASFPEESFLLFGVCGKIATKGIFNLRDDLKKVLKESKYQTLGITNFHAIPMNKIPGDDSSVSGHNVRGVYWTKPDETGKEVMRDKPIDESQYTELVSEFKNTYFEEVYNGLRSKYRYHQITLVLN